ncbi:unnamed protein product [Phaeothamnion confervicola]
MPTVNIVREDLFEALGKRYTEGEFDALCFDFGIELDEVTSEAEELAKSQGAAAVAEVGSAAADDVIYKIDIPANRYDLLCIEGLTRALNVFLGRQAAPLYRCSAIPAEQRQVMVVKAATATVRPYVVCAVLRGVTFDQKRYKSFIDLQDKLHQNICRRRTLVAVGTHDLATVRGPFVYDAQPPDAIEFVPLTPADCGPFKARALLDFYNTDLTARHLKPYTSIIYDSELYPCIFDADGVLLSLPPVINGYHSRIRMETRDVFIECTATDKTKASIVLDTVVTMFSEYCTEPFTAEPVDVRYEADGHVETTPLLSTRTQKASLDTIRSYIGVTAEELPSDEICDLCVRMQLGPAALTGGTDGDGGGGGGEIGAPASVAVTVPPTRSDILHEVDVIEDVAIAFGFNNIPIRMPATQTVGGGLRINGFCDLLRDEVSRAGYCEMLTHGLCSRAENFAMLRRSPAPCVSLINPAVIEYEVVRTALLPGALKTMQYNKGIAVKDGIKLFETSDVVLPDDTTDTGARNCRRLVATYMGMAAGFEVIHGLVDRIMTVSQVPPTEDYAGASLREGDVRFGGPWREGFSYWIRPAEDPAYFPGRCAAVMLRVDDEETVLGTFGVLHPEVLAAYELGYPCSAVEIDLEPLV